MENWNDSWLKMSVKFWVKIESEKNFDLRLKTIVVSPPMWLSYDENDLRCKWKMKFYCWQNNFNHIVLTKWDWSLAVDGIIKNKWKLIIYRAAEIDDYFVC